uniref:Peptidase A2 domain-containing protein n=1 Tax=Cannabis sativa TaxID=3483 RepID=A0A803P937_CANSA
MIVARMMIDIGASSKVLFEKTLERMGLSLKDLEPCDQLLYGFSGDGISPYGKIKLPFTVGTAPRKNTNMSTFIVVDTKSPYNIMIGRPGLYDFQGILSIYHLSVTFSVATDNGRLLGNQ